MGDWQSPVTGGRFPTVLPIAPLWHWRLPCPRHLGWRVTGDMGL